MTRTRLELHDIGTGQALMVAGGRLSEAAIAALERFIEGEGKLALIEIETSSDVEFWVIDRLLGGRIRIASRPWQQAIEPEPIRVIEHGPADQPVLVRSAKELASDDTYRDVDLLDQMPPEIRAHAESWLSARAEQRVRQLALEPVPQLALDSGAQPDPNDIPPGWGRAKARAQMLTTNMLGTPTVNIGDGCLLIIPAFGAPNVLTLSSARRFARDLDEAISVLAHHLVQEGYPSEEIADDPDE